MRVTAGAKPYSALRRRPVTVAGRKPRGGRCGVPSRKLPDDPSCRTTTSASPKLSIPQGSGKGSRATLVNGAPWRSSTPRCAVAARKRIWAVRGVGGRDDQTVEHVYPLHAHRPIRALRPIFGSLTRYFGLITPSIMPPRSRRPITYLSRPAFSDFVDGREGPRQATSGRMDRW